MRPKTSRALKVWGLVLMGWCNGFVWGLGRTIPDTFRGLIIIVLVALITASIMGKMDFE